jgi:hypothetical protein
MLCIFEHVQWRWAINDSTARGYGNHGSRSARRLRRGSLRQHGGHASRVCSSIWNLPINQKFFQQMRSCRQPVSVSWRLVRLDGVDDRMASTA